MSVSDKIVGAVEGVTKKWKRQRKAEERAASAALRREHVMTRSRRYTTKDAAWEIMLEAYMKASAGNTLPANARQIMYAARGHILSVTGESRLGDQYFTQQLLPDYLREHPEETMDWDVVYDDRGHFREPHTDREIGLGTVAVRTYLREVEQFEPDDGGLDVSIPERIFPTCGPVSRYGAILFIEKEGFHAPLQSCQAR